MPEPDLDRLLPLLGEGTVLGLGEPTHGSANAFAWKLGILQELARHGQLAALALEDSLIADQQLDRALRGHGDVDAYLAAGSTVWCTVQIREGLRQLVEITAAAPPEQRPRGLGIDIRAPHRTARALLDLGHDDPLLRAVADRSTLAPEDVTALDALCARARPMRACTPSAPTSSRRRSSCTPGPDDSSAGGSTPRCSTTWWRCARPSRWRGPAQISMPW